MLPSKRAHLNSLPAGSAFGTAFPHVAALGNALVRLVISQYDANHETSSSRWKSDKVDGECKRAL
jgi:hypothetical protein